MRFQKTTRILLLLLVSFSQAGLAAERYSVSKKIVEGHTTYHLLDSTLKMDLGLAPDVGNFAYELKMNGKDVFIPAQSFKSYLEKHWFCCGNPFLSPWANRIDHDYYYFQGKKYLLNDDLGNLLRDQFKQVIHGLLVFDPRWEIVKSGASDQEGAFVTSRLEFCRYPDLMAQFPFAHTIETTYRLKDGKLANTTVVTNVSRAPMPVMMAYHPYFRPDGPREDWTLSVGAKTHWIPSKQLISTGETEPIEKFLPGSAHLTLGKTFLDDVFSDFDRSKDGFGHISVQGKTQKIEIVYGKELDFAVIYAPLDNTLICVEPQTGPTNSFNLNHEGKFAALTVLAPGKSFKATYWIVPTGY